MTIKKRILIIVLAVVTLFSLYFGSFSVYSLSTGFFLELHSAVYMDASETKFNGDKLTLEEGETINSVTITLINTSNKDFDDYEVRAMYYDDFHVTVSSENDDFTYPEGYSLYQIIDIGAKETVTVTFTKFRNTWHYDDELRVAFEYVYNRDVDSDGAGAWWQLDTGNEFKSYYNLTFILLIIFNSLIFIGCSTSITIILVKNLKKKNKDLQ